MSSRRRLHEPSAGSSWRLARRSLLGGIGLVPFVLAGCGARDDDQAPVSGDQELLRDLGYEGADAQEIIDQLEALPVAERPRGLMASVMATALGLSDAAGREVELSLPQNKFYLSVAPFRDSTHECAYHSLTTCLGELRRQDVTVSVVDDSSGDPLEDGTRTTGDNGFLGIWLPRGITAELTCTVEDLSGTASISTQEEDDLTCLTSLQLR
ncbi:CueP family metal-binding protein [Brachybacterium sp. AOP3-A1-3]|uniref:CueP family metal-binding protein n=1 Tax=Brachybacterium sp. AOP3-A1-3 TaxID=3457699 RepID=UPI004034B66F